jgi:hypothetical protein
MLARRLSQFSFTTIFCLLFVSAALAQAGHPVKGSWLGFYGPDAGEQRRMRLLFDWKDQELLGVINPGRYSVDIDSVSIDYDTWTMTIEANLPRKDGEMARFVATGVIDNLGSWTNRRYKGSYTHGAESGEFQFLIN